MLLASQVLQLLQEEQLDPAVLALARSLRWVLGVVRNGPAILLVPLGWGSFSLQQ